jgi:hypothetical protein
MTNYANPSFELDQPQAIKSTSFTGPLFIVGMQRSGTKLLRTLLNEHPQISIISAETHFLPHWVKTWKRFGDLSDPLTFAEFYRHMQKCPYFIHTKNRASSTRQQKWYEMCKSYTPDGVYEALMRTDTGVDYRSNGIWGDKSTSYLNHLPLLKTLFPQAKVIHIIRDVRDYCLSVDKAWKKNMIRAAQRWVDSITKARLDSHSFATDYLEIKYEDLLEDPEQQLEKCCRFLGLESNSAMLNLSRAPENIGDAKGYHQIKSDNKNKYRVAMTPYHCQKIEAIAGEILGSLGYDVSYSGKTRRVSNLEMTYYRILDGINFLIQEAGRVGVVKTLNIELGSYITSRVQK